MIVFFSALLASVVGCQKTDDPPAAPNPAGETAQVSNRVAIPEQVRKNLGITFARVESRRVSQTLRVPGRFELLPSARREYRTILPARVELLVRQYERVQPEQVLARLDSPEWRKLQHEAVEAEGEIKVAEAGIDVADAAVAENQTAIDSLALRTAALAEANASRAEVTADLAMARSKSARLAAEARSARVKLAEAREHYISKLRTLAAVLGIVADRLMQPVTLPTTAPAAGSADGAKPVSPETVPYWRTIETVEIRAAGAGIVEAMSVTNGGWADASSLLLTVVDTSQIRFRAVALQADLAKLRDNAQAEIVPPGGAVTLSKASTQPASLPGHLTISLEASSDFRTVDLIVTPDRLADWSRPGVSCFAEIVIEGAAAPAPAIPVAAVIQDELAKVFFRRDPKDLDKVIRVEGDFGISDGRWVVVESGVKPGDEVVLEGIYELKLAGGGKTAGGKGHFHADGTWHAEGTPEPGGK